MPNYGWRKQSKCCFDSDVLRFAEFEVLSSRYRELTVSHVSLGVYFLHDILHKIWWKVTLFLNFRPSCLLPNRWAQQKLKSLIISSDDYHFSSVTVHVDSSPWHYSIISGYLSLITDNVQTISVFLMSINILCIK